MTTVTVILGGPETGKRLVGHAIAGHIVRNHNQTCLAIEFMNKVDIKKVNDVNDLILISRSNKIEHWMHPWFDKFGQPLFIITITRQEAKAI